MQMKKIAIFILILLVAAGFWYLTQKKETTKPTPPQQQSTSTSQNDPPKIVSTNPDPLEDNIVSATQTIEISFNRPLQNSGEFKLRIEPKIDFKINLSSDRKTAKISFPKPLELGLTYTIFIGTDTKFDEVGAWNQEKIYHFKTVAYKGV